MYESLTITLMNLSVWKNIIVGISVCSFIWIIFGFLWYYFVYQSDDSNIKKRMLFASCLFAIITFVGSFVAYNIKWLDPNWRIALEVSKRVDKYVEMHPGSIYDPDRLLVEVDKTVVSVFESVQRVPEIIEKLASGKTIDAIRNEANAKKEKEQYEAFKKWQKSQESQE